MIIDFIACYISLGVYFTVVLSFIFNARDDSDKFILIINSIGSAKRLTFIVALWWAYWPLAIYSIFKDSK